MAAPNSPSRPERSSARASAAGHSAETSTDGHGANGGAGGGISGVAMAASNGVVNVYNRAPDLGVNSTMNSAYQRAPDLGEGAAINKYLGQSEEAPSTIQKQGSYRKEPNFAPQDDDDEYEHDRVIRPGDNKKKAPEEKEEVKETRREESERLGPSDESRVGKTQMEIGTETGIPTAAGAGSTASADKSNVEALKKAESKGNVNKAHVPEDFEAQYCPTDNAGTGKSDNVTRSANTESSQPAQSHSHGEKEKPGRKSTSGHSNRSSGSHDYHYTHASSGAGSEKRHSHKSQTVMTSDGNEYEVEKRRSFGNKIKDQIKGEFKILSGTVTNNDEKIIQGLHIKDGDHE